jgi:hypothetical protein
MSKTKSRRKPKIRTVDAPETTDKGRREAGRPRRRRTRRSARRAAIAESLALLVALSLIGCGEISMVVPPEDGGAPDDAMVSDGSTDDASILDDASAPDAEEPDAGDAGTVDTDAGEGDAGTDAGTLDAGPPPCLDTWDGVTGRCYIRVHSETCPSTHEPITWASRAEQVRIYALIAPLGSGGTGLRRAGLVGAWSFADGTEPDSIAWVATYPRSTEPHTYFSSDGLRSYHRPYPYQFCMR